MPHQTTFAPEVTTVLAGGLTFESRHKLSDGNEIPVIGFGTYELDGIEAYKAVTAALETGYRLIDSAEWYENEKEVGKAISDFCAAYSVPRSEIFFTTKLKLNNGFAHAIAAAKKSVQRCGLGYVDLYLMHGPIGGKAARQESWRGIVEAQKEGLVKSIGISTFGIRHINDILEMKIGTPVVHQIDLHPFQTRASIVAYSREHGMLMEAWGPLVRGMRFGHPLIVSLSKKYAKSPSQILLRYSVQKGFVPIPKSTLRERIVENTQIFDFQLARGEVDALDQLDEGLVTDWDPTACE
ncbi:aldo-keto reductase [Lyophyllum atratum]|nr:aldo-keto reductase [Lyophyllum atratum]